MALCNLRHTSIEELLMQSLRSWVAFCGSPSAVTVHLWRSVS